MEISSISSTNFSISPYEPVPNKIKEMKLKTRTMDFKIISLLNKTYSLHSALIDSDSENDFLILFNSLNNGKDLSLCFEPNEDAMKIIIDYIYEKEIKSNILNRNNIIN